MHWLQKFAVAFRGLWEALRQELHLKVHALASVLVVALAIWLNVSLLEGAILAVAIAAVWTAELLNSSLERTARAMKQPNDPHLRDALDMAAGAVLVIAIGAAAVGVMILGPKLWAIFANTSQH